MMNEFIRRIEKAKSKKHLNKVEQEARKKYGLWSKDYAKILDLCYEKLNKLKEN